MDVSSSYAQNKRCAHIYAAIAIPLPGLLNAAMFFAGFAIRCYFRRCRAAVATMLPRMRVIMPEQPSLCFSTFTRYRFRRRALRRRHAYVRRCDAPP